MAFIMMFFIPMVTMLFVPIVIMAVPPNPMMVIVVIIRGQTGQVQETGEQQEDPESQHPGQTLFLEHENLLNMITKSSKNNPTQAKIAITFNAIPPIFSIGWPSLSGLLHPRSTGASNIRSTVLSNMGNSNNIGGFTR